MKLLWLVALAALAGCAADPALPASPLTGTWRSNQAELTLSAGGGTVEFGCASGTVGAVNLDARGAFRVAGTFTPGSPVSRIEDPPPVPQPATYSGRVAGGSMTFVLEFADGTENSPITVVRDGDEPLIRCA